MAQDRTAHAAMREDVLEEPLRADERVAARVEEERVDGLVAQVAERSLGLRDAEDPAPRRDRTARSRVVNRAVFGDPRVGETIQTQLTELPAEVQDAVHLCGP
ncbi:MAG: hypothetical protein R3B82_11030 [Sandaracinaceae bacterium]